MGIVDEDIARVREATDVAAVIGEQVALKRVGGRLVGLCPFHTEKTPSFSVNAAEGLFYCFGCQARGDIITFVRETQQLDFVGAVEYLAGRAGIQLRYDSSAATREHHRKSELTEAMEAAVEWYHQRLLTAPDAGPARRYLRDRGYDADTVRTFKLGWAPDAWDELSKALPFPADVMRDAGLSLRNKAGRQMDVFRGRVVFPIFDVGGRPVGLGGRILPGADGPKYKNSQEGPLYSKRRVLYGLNWAKSDIVTHGEVIVCEGYTDVIAFHRAGIPRAVATCGTALAEEHMAVLKNFARRIILAYDDDAAGQGAAEKFYAWEQKLELDIHVLRLPRGADPGSTDPATLQEAVASARPFLDFWVERVLEAANLRTAEGRARGAERALVAIASHPNDLVRDQYVMRLADRCQVPADRLRARIDQLRHEPQQEPPARRPAEPRPGVEIEALRLAVHRPEEVAQYLEEALFEDPVNRTALHALLTAETLQDAIDQAGPEAATLLHRLAVEEPDPAIEAEDIVAVLVRAAAGRAVAQIEAEARASGSLVNLAWAKQRIEWLMEPDHRIEAASELVAWLVGGGQEEA
jgi:DNA primase